METGKELALDSLDKLKRMCRLFREHGDSIASGHAKLSLTSNILFEVNESFENLENNLCPQRISIQSGDSQDWHQRDELGEWNDYLQLLRDVFASAINLKLHNGSTDSVGARWGLSPMSMSHSVHLGCFSHLQHLEISYLPVHLLQDLLTLRHRLVSLVVHNCLGHNTKLQDLLELCDQEVSVPMHWSALKTLNLKCNLLKELDGSLRLCPVLETLVVSLNRLTSTDVYLGYLMELLRVDLRFNRLQSLPILSATVKRKLRVLLLGGNNISDIRGMEELVSLVELDLSENLISTHCKLEPLKHLHHLQKLDLRGCPVSMRKNHRVTTLQHMSSLALHLEVTFDGCLVSSKEVRKAQLASMYYSSRHAVPKCFRTSTQNSTSHGIMGNSHAVTSSIVKSYAAESVQPSSVLVVQGGKKKGRKKVKARTTVIADLDTSTGEFSSGTDTPRSSPRVTSKLEAVMQARREEVKQTQQELERMRLQYGNNWLQAIVDQKKLPPPTYTRTARTSLGTAASTTSSIQKTPTPAFIHTDPGSVPSAAAAYPDVSVEACMKDGVNAGKTADFCTSVESGEHEASLDIYARKDTSGPKTREDKAVHDVKTPALTSAPFSDCAAGDDARISNDKVTILLSSASNKNNVQGDSTVASTESPAKPGVVNGGFYNDECVITRRHDLEGERRKDQTNVSEGLKDSDIGQEPEGQGEPFIVILPEKNNDHLIVTVSPRFIVEKDINGRLQEMLDLQCLLSVKLEAEDDTVSSVYETSSLVESNKVLTVRMQFDYFRKDRRSRVYVMEDRNSAEQFMALVQPFVSAREQALLERMQREYQCLKCSKVFTWENARKGTQELGIPLRGSSKGFSDLTDEVSLICPDCGSDHVILLENNEGQTTNVAVVSPSGSLPSTRGLSVIGRNKSFEQLIGSHSWKISHSLHKEGRTNSERRTSDSFRSLSPIRDHSSSNKREESSTRSKSISSASSASAPQVQSGRQRSNAFYNEPSPGEARMRSNAFISDYNHSEGPQEHIFPHNLSSLASAEHGFQIQHSLPPSGMLHSLYMEDTNIIYGRRADSSSDLEKAVSRGKVSSAESDITILHKPDSVANLSTCSFPGKDSDSVLESSLTEFPDIHDTVDRAGDLENSNSLNSKSAIEKKIFSLTSPTPAKDAANAEVTPIGTPLSSSICSSMVSSIYQNSLQPSASTTASDNGSITARGAVPEGEINTDLDEDRINTDWSSQSQHKYSVTSELDVLAVEEARAVETVDSETPETDDCDSKDYDFDRLDHRITLYLMMNKFDNNEEFRFKVKVFVSQYMVEDEWEALLIATNLKLYIFRINDSDISEDLSTALTCRDIQPLGELKQVASGLGQQTMRLEFVTDCSSYTLIFRDKEKTQAFMQRLCDHLTIYAMETSLPMTTVFIEDVDQATLENLKSDVMTRSGRVESLRLYTLGYIARGHNLHSPMAFVVSSSEICLIRTNHQWPSPRYQAPVTVDTVGKQFVVLERQKINNIATLTWHSDNTTMMRITFFNEKSGEEGSWIITMETEKCVMQMIEAIREPWEEEFAIKMDVEFTSFELSF